MEHEKIIYNEVMHNAPRNTTLRLFLRSTLPSAIELVFCLLGGLFILALQLLNANLDQSVLSATSFNGQQASTFVHELLTPLRITLDNSVLNSVLGVALWGLFGLVVYSLISFCIGLANGWRSSEHNIRFIHAWQIEYHPERRTFILRLLWRFGISIATFLFTLVLLLFVGNTLLNSARFLDARSFAMGSAVALCNVAAWAVIFHCYVVLLRLYMFRTRLFGEIVY